jgi:hypothetical protein
VRQRGLRLLLEGLKVGAFMACVVVNQVACGLPRPMMQNVTTADELSSESVAMEAARIDAAVAGAAPRSHQEVARFFEGLEMIEPGLVQLHRWRPGAGVQRNGRELAAYGGVGRKT